MQVRAVIGEDQVEISFGVQLVIQVNFNFHNTGVTNNITTKSFTKIEKKLFQIIIPERRKLFMRLCNHFHNFSLSIFAKQFFTHINFPSVDIVKLFPLDIKLRYFRQNG